MAVQQLTQPILNPIAAFDATKEQTISFVVIGGAQVVANRLVIQDNQTGVEIYSNIESTLKLEHTIPANTLKNGGYYNAVVYTLDNSNTLSSPSTPVPFYCYTQPLLTITNIPATETIENGTYTFEGSYSQIEGELLNSYQFTLYDSNKEVLSQTPLIYYETDSSLSYTFVGMNNDTSYYIELSGQTLNNTSMSTGLLYFTVRYIQPASFAICDLVNDCKDGYVQISSNIVAIDGHSNPDPPIYIDDKELDLRDPDSYVEWNSGFRIQDDFTMRAWGRDFNDYQNIITLTNDINTEETPNKIELKWMLGDVVKEQLSYEDINGELINVSDSVTAPIKNLEIYGNSIQVDRNADVYVEGKSTQEVQAESFKTATGNPVTITDGELDKPVKLGQIDGLSTQETRILPEEYQQLEYIITDGFQTIDTNYKPNNNTRIITKFQYASATTDKSQYNTLFGILSPSISDVAYNIRQFDYGYTRASYNTSRDITLDQSLNNSNLHVVDFNKNLLYLDGNLLKTFNEGVFQANTNLFIFNDRKNIESTGKTGGKMKMYYFIIYENNNIIRNFIPCYRKSDNTIGLYDLINNSFYTNSNTAFIKDFSKGNDIQIPSPEFPSEIQSVGDDVNLFDKDNATITSLNCDGGTTFYNAQTTKSIIFDCSKYEQLAISKKIGNYFAIIASSKYPVAGVAGVIGTRLAIDDTKSKDFFSINCKDYNYLTIVFWRNTDTITESQMLDTIKIQKGTVATSYSEYGKGTVTIEQRGKNKCYDCTLVNNKQTLRFYFDKNIDKNCILSFSTNESLVGRSLYLVTDDTNSQLISTVSGDANSKVSKNITFTDAQQELIKNSKKVCLQVYKKEGNFELPNDAQIEEGKEPTDYEPYFSKDYVLQTAPLRSLPNGVKDTLEADGIHRRVGSVILDGSEDNWGTLGDNRYYLPIQDKRSLTTSVPCNIVSNYFKSSDNAGDSILIGYMTEGYYTTGNKNIFFNYNGSNNNLAGFKTWLSTHNTEVLYELAEEVVEPYTSDQKEVLNSITTQSGTNIFDAQTNMELKYNYNYEIPSPEVESPIKSIGDDINLFDESILSEYTDRGITWKYDDITKKINISGTATSSYSQTNYLSLSLKPGTYYFSSFGDTSLKYGIWFYNSANKLIGTIKSNGSIRITEDVAKIILFVEGLTSGNNYLKNMNFKLQKGDQSTPYSKYGEGTVTIEQRGKNKINPDKPSPSQTDGGITITNNGDGSYTAKGTSTKALSIQLTSPNIIKLKANTYYTNSIEVLKGTMTGSITVTVKKSDNTIGYNYINVNNSNKTNTQISVEDLTIYAYSFYCASGTKVDFTFRVQLEEGTEATDYEPYFSKDYVIPLSEPLRSLPKGTKDILNNKGITRRVGKIVLNGSENWEGFISSYKNTIRAQVLISDMHNIGNNVGLNIMSSHFLPKNLYVNDIVGIEHIHNQLYIRIKKYDLDEISLNGFKAWLAAHPTEVIYELATAQNESYEGQTPSPDRPSPIISVGDVKNLIDVPDFNVDYNQQYYQDTNTNFLLKPNYTYTLSFDFNINKSSTDLYYSLGYGTDRYATDITKTTIYSTQTKGRNEITFTVPADIPDNSYLWVRFARTIILADINVDISNIQLEKGKKDTGYQPTTYYNIYPTVSSKNLFDYDNPLYIRTNNLNYNEISNGYHMSPISVGENTEFTIGIENCFNEGDIYALSFSQLGEFGYVAMYKTLKGTQERVNIIDLNNNIFTAPSQNYDLELVFSMPSSALSNSLEIWSIQIEANNTQTTYETHEENSSIITLDTPLNRIGDYADWVGNISPNLLNPVTGSAIVEENTDYFYNKKSTYTASVTIQYKNADGNVISSETLTNDSTISTPENCVEIHIEGLNEQAIKTNHLQIRKGNSNKPYLPYITEPSLIKVTGKIVLDGSESWGISGTSTSGIYRPVCSALNGIIKAPSSPNISPAILCNYYNAITNNQSYTKTEGISIATSGRIEIYDSNYDTDDISLYKDWLSTHNTEVIYVLAEPEITPLSSLNSEALKTLETYEPISNVYTNNKLLGTLDLDYANGKDMKEVQNAYVLLKCWNGNKMPYVIHSNYIDIPESTENIFIWMRRKKNIFDLRIENLTKGD